MNLRSSYTPRPQRALRRGMLMLFRNEKKDDREQGSGPVRVPLLPLRDIIVFPHMVVPLFVGRQRSIKALEEATQKQSLVFLSSQKDAKTNDPSEDDIYKIGTLGSVVQMLKEKGFTENELADSKSKLMKHIHRFYDPFPDEIKLVEYFASHMVALIPCSNYQSFMENSFRVVPEINMTDISEALKDSFKDDSRQVLISQPEESVLTESDIKETLGQFESDKIDFVYTEPERVVIEAEKDAFFQLPITDNEQSMIKDIIQTVGPTSKVRLAWLRSDLEKKKMKK